MVDVMCIREVYERREITEVKWVDGNSNPADSMTKSKATLSLKQLIDTNKLNIKVQEWVKHIGDCSSTLNSDLGGLEGIGGIGEEKIGI